MKKIKTIPTRENQLKEYGFKNIDKKLIFRR